MNNDINNKDANDVGLLKNDKNNNAINSKNERSNHVGILKERTNDRICLFIVGVLIGAVISTAAFVAYVKTLGVDATNSGAGMAQMQNMGTPPEMPNESGSQQGKGSQQGNGPQGQGQQNAPGQNQCNTQSQSSETQQNSKS